MLKNMTIGRKLYVFFGVISVVVLMVIGFSVYVVGQLREFSDDIKNYNSIQERIKTGKNLQLNVANVWQFFTDASLTKERNVIEKEAKPNFDKAMSDIDKLSKLTKDDPELTKKLEVLKVDIDKVWKTGSRMFDGYMADWKKGNAIMDEYDKICDKAIQETAEIVNKIDKLGEESVAEMIQMSSSATKGNRCCSHINKYIGLISGNFRTVPEEVHYGSPVKDCRRFRINSRGRY